MSHALRVQIVASDGCKFWSNRFDRQDYGVQLQLELAGQPVMPDMMYKTLDIFNPHNAKLIAATAAGMSFM